MPKPTFLNLSIDKRKRFIDAALQEFSDYEYRAASLNRIVAGADIAKGSIYQYFENKKDLYEYLVLYAAREKYRFLAIHVSTNTTLFKTIITDFFTLCRVFDFENPVLGKLLVNTAQEVENDELDSFLSDFKKECDSFYAEFVKSAASRRLIKENIDYNAAGYLINSFDKMICDFYERKSGELYLDLVLDQELSTEEKLEKIKPAIDYFVKVLLASLS